MIDPERRSPIRRTAQIGVDGTARIDCVQITVGYVWAIDYVTVSCSDSIAIGVGALYESVIDYAHFIDGVTANRAVAENTRARYLEGGENLVAYFSGWPAGVNVALRVEYREQVAG